MSSLRQNVKETKPQTHKEAHDDDVCFINEYNVNVLEWKDKKYSGVCYKSKYNICILFLHLCIIILGSPGFVSTKIKNNKPQRTNFMIG